MAGAVGIVFGLCVLSFTAGAALMYIVVRRREEPEQQPPAPPPPVVPEEAPVEPRWEETYETKPIHRNPVLGLPDKPADPEPQPVPPPAEPHEDEQTSPSDRDEFRQRYLRTFEEARRRAAGPD